MIDEWLMQMIRQSPPSLLTILNIGLVLNRTNPEDLKNTRQIENYNYQKVSAFLADYGYSTVRLTDDWQGADFVAQSMFGNNFPKIQLKARIEIAKKYREKDLWMCFRVEQTWYLVEHDALMNLVLERDEVGSSEGVVNSKSSTEEGRGAYNWKQPSKKLWNLIQNQLELVKL